MAATYTAQRLEARTVKIMPTRTVEERTRNVVSAIFNIPFEKIDLATSCDTVPNWDSLNLVNLMMALESEFDIHLDIEDAADLLSVSLILAVLDEKDVK